MEKLFVTYGKTVSMDVDAQNGFTPNCLTELPVPEGNEIVEECNKNATKAAFRYMSKDAHPSQSAWTVDENPMLTPVGLPNVDVCWPRHCVVGTYGFELIDGLPKPSEYNFIVYKGAEFDMHPYSPIYHDLAKKISTGVIEKAKCDGVDTFILGGLALDYCLGEAAFDLKNAGFRVIVNLGATRAIGDAQAFIEKAKEKGIEFVETADEICELPF
jgi:nicotinamidase/pyrazinamidase